MNLPIVPNQILAPRKRREPDIAIISERIKTLRLPIILSIELEERAAIPAATAIEALNNP